MLATALNELAPSQPSHASPVRRIHSKLQELFGIDLRSLALLRMGLGLSVLTDVAMRAFDLVGLYTDRGVLPRDLLIAMEGRGVYLSAHYWASAHPLLQGALFAVTAVCAAALVVGWRTRLATLACWYLVASVQIRQPLVYMGGDSILRLLLFWGMFLPLAARFSLDEKQRRIPARSDWFFSGATVAILIQVCLIYVATGVRKTGDLWWNGQAIFYALNLDEWATPLGVRMRDYPSVLEPITYATLALELFGPFVAFVPVYTWGFRLATIAAFWTFHLGLAATMNIGLFPLFSMVAWLPFIPTQAWTWCGSTMRTVAERPPDWRARLASIVALVCLTYVIVLLAERARVIPRVLPGPVTAVGTALRIQQTWNMFAPDPPSTTAHRDIRKTMWDGSQVTEPAATSFRWTAYLNRAATSLPPNHPLAASLRSFAHFHCGYTRPDDASRVERIAILMHQRHIDSNRQGEVTTRTLIDERCPTE